MQHFTFFCTARSVFVFSSEIKPLDQLVVGFGLFVGIIKKKTTENHQTGMSEL